jgi:flavin-dependent dehydrogenase
MLETARALGIVIIQARVTDIEIHADRVVIYTESNAMVADVVVGAFGLDEGTAAIFHRAVGYESPLYLNTVVTKYHPGEENLEKFGDGIHVFLPASQRIEFGAVTPKGNHLTINIAGMTADANLMDTFFSLPEVKDVLPCLENNEPLNSQNMIYHKGRFPRGLARNYIGDRFIMVGDAAGLVRAFKGKGVTSAFQTGIRAARVILQEGISAIAFQAYIKANQDILEDLPYGRAMRLLTIVSSSIGLMDIAIAAAENNPDLRLAFFDAVSAHRPYKEVVRRVLSPSSVVSIAKALITPHFRH